MGGACKGPSYREAQGVSHRETHIRNLLIEGAYKESLLGMRIEGGAYKESLMGGAHVRNPFLGGSRDLILGRAYKESRVGRRI